MGDLEGTCTEEKGGQLFSIKLSRGYTTMVLESKVTCTEEKRNPQASRNLSKGYTVTRVP